jgi:hypothetical protein
MADSIVGGLFGTPQEYQTEQNRQALAQATQLGQLDPFSAARTGLIYGGRQLAGALGGQDPQLQLISQRNAIMQGVNLNDPEALQEVSSRLAQIGDMRGAYGAAELAQKRAESNAAINLREAQAIKASMTPKLTGDERYIAQLRSVENTLRQGKTPSDDDLSQANIASQMLAKPRSFYDQASGQTVVVPATDPSKAFPLTFKEFAGSQEQPTTKTEGGTTLPPTATKPSMPTTGVATVQKVTEGNLPAGSQTEIANIEKQLIDIKNREPQLKNFLEQIQEGKVKYNLLSNAYDFAGSIVPPMFGKPEVGNQVTKDEVQRVLTARVNAVLNTAKGVQAKDDAQRAKDQIASPSTFLSPQRMESAIRDLQRAEASLTEELSTAKSTLQSRGQPTTKPTTTTPAPQGKTGELSREEKINVFIRANGGKPTRQQAEEFLKSKGLLN